MLRTLLISIAALAASASLARAQINLAWNNCIASASSASNKSFACDDNGTSTPALTLVASFVTPMAMNLIGSDCQIDLQSAGSSLPDWWRMRPDPVAECRAEAMSSASPAGLSSLCINPALGIAIARSLAYRTEYGAPNRARVISGIAGVEPVPVTPGNQVYASRIEIELFHTVPDPEDPSDPVCGGCQVPVCMVLNRVQAYREYPEPLVEFTDPGTRNYVTWQGGDIGDGGCPGATPVRDASWGSIKALYR